MTQRDLSLFFLWGWLQVLHKESVVKACKQRYQVRHREAIRARARARYINDPESMRARVRRWREENPEKTFETRRRYRLENSKRIAEGVRKWKQENRARRQRVDRIWKKRQRETNPDWRMRQCLSKRVWDALRGITKKGTKTQDLVGCSFSDLRGHIQSQFQPGMTWDNYGQWHIDHIRPCASFDLTDPEQQRACFNFKNLQPLWAADNLRKGTKYHAP